MKTNTYNHLIVNFDPFQEISGNEIRNIVIIKVKNSIDGYQNYFFKKEVID